MKPSCVMPQNGSALLEKYLAILDGEIGLKDSLVQQIIADDEVEAGCNPARAGIGRLRSRHTNQTIQVGKILAADYMVIGRVIPASESVVVSRNEEVASLLRIAAHGAGLPVV